VTPSRDLPPGALPKRELVGIPIAATDYVEAMDVMDGMIARGERGYVCAVAVHAVMVARHDPEMRAALLGASLTVVTGGMTGAVIAGFLAVAALAVVSYWRTSGGERVGTTTESAALATYWVGAIAGTGALVLAAAIGITIAILLRARQLYPEPQKLEQPGGESGQLGPSYRLYLVGGRRVLAIDPGSRQVSVAAQLRVSLSDPTATTVGRRIVVTGGGTNGVWALTSS